MNRILYLILLMFFQAGIVSAQGIEFDTKHVDIGEVRNWGLQPAVFHFTNTSSSRVFIMKTDMNPDLRVIYPKGYINPGKSDSILVYFIPKRKESFKASFDLWASDRSKPYHLSIEGNTVSLDECPGTPAATNPEPERLVRVVEKGSRNPVSAAEVTLVRSRNENLRDHTDRRGQYSRNLKPGLYRVQVKHRDYIPMQDEFYLDRSTMILVFEIEKRVPDEEPEPVAVIPVDTVPESEPEPEPVVIIEPDPIPLDTLVPYPGRDSLGDQLLPWSEYRQNNIVFLVDVSSSMRSKDKLSLLKASMAKLVTVVRGVDNVSIVVYANEPEVLVEGASGDEKLLLGMTVDSLQAKGKTYGIKGLNKAYEIAERNFIPGANNLVIVATDGEFNSPDYSSFELMNLVREYSRQDINTSVIGFGQGTRSGLRMRQMATAGNGSYMHIDSDSDDVEEILVEEIKKRSKRH